MSNPKILIVDDIEDIRNFVKDALAPEGYELIEASNGRDAMALFKREKPTLILLDISMGQPDGFEVCREVRKISEVPIIMLTSHVQEMDEAMCLAAGADDYITKPVSARILTLRVSTQLRHLKLTPITSSTSITAGPLHLDLDTRELKVDDKDVELTRTEYDFLRLLIEYPKKVFTREEISSAIGVSYEFSSDHLLDTHASRLRGKIREHSDIKILHAVRGVGYRLLSN